MSCMAVLPPPFTFRKYTVSNSSACSGRKEAVSLTLPLSEIVPAYGTNLNSLVGEAFSIVQDTARVVRFATSIVTERHSLVSLTTHRLKSTVCVLTLTQDGTTVILILRLMPSGTSFCPTSSTGRECSNSPFLLGCSTNLTGMLWRGGIVSK